MKNKVNTTVSNAMREKAEEALTEIKIILKWNGKVSKRIEY